jgi:hypothetical protein
LFASSCFEIKTKRLDNLKYFWKRNKTKAFGPKILRTDRKRFVSIQNFDLKTFTFDLFLERKEQNVSFRSWKIVDFTLLPRFKPLSIEMDLAESGFNRKAFIKWRDAEIFGKICPTLLLVRAFKVCQLLLVFLIGHYESNCQLRAKNPHPGEMFLALGSKARSIHCSSSYL